MSDEFDGLDAKASIGATLNRCRALAAKIANELRNKRPEHFVDRLSLADAIKLCEARTYLKIAGRSRSAINVG